MPHTWLKSTLFLCIESHFPRNNLRIHFITCTMDRLDACGGNGNGSPAESSAARRRTRCWATDPGPLTHHYQSTLSSRADTLVHHLPLTSFIVIQRKSRSGRRKEEQSFLADTLFLSSSIHWPKKWLGGRIIEWVRRAVRFTIGTTVKFMATGRQEERSSLQQFFLEANNLHHYPIHVTGGVLLISFQLLPPRSTTVEIATTGK